MEDVSPKLLKQVQDSFQASFDNDKRLKKIYEKIEAGTATYSEANDFAVYAGEHLAKAYKQITSADLPDGRMYYNIANSIIPPTMTNNYDLVSQVATQIQQNLNEEAGIGLKTITPELNEDRIDGIVNRISSEANFDDISWILDSPIVDFSQSIVDDSIRENAEFHGEAGMTPKIIRKNAYFGCCDWCSKLEGTYIYPDVPQDVYRRHDNCRCKVDYHPGNGKKQNVHSREWRKETKIANNFDFLTKPPQRLMMIIKIINLLFMVIQKNFLQKMEPFLQIKLMVMKKFTYSKVQI